MIWFRRTWHSLFGHPARAVVRTNGWWFKCRSCGAIFESKTDRLGRIGGRR